MFVGLEKDLIDPKQGEQPRVTIGFDEKLHRATVTVTGEQNGYKNTWNFKPVNPGNEFLLTWKQGFGEVDYMISVETVLPSGEKSTEEAWIFVAAAEPIAANIPADSVDMETRSFDLVSNHPPSHVDLEIMDDERRIIGTSTFNVRDAVQGKAVRVTWEEPLPGNIFKISATAHDQYGYWAGVDIIPWSLSIPHEDVNFESGKHEILAEEAPKVDVAWEGIKSAVDKYGDWVQCTLYVAGYTDTVGDHGSNQSLSQRRALSLAQYFRAKGASFPILYQGFGESVLAVETGDSVDSVANRRALYIITAGPPPRTKDTPRASWKRLP